MMNRVGNISIPSRSPLGVLTLLLMSLMHSGCMIPPIFYPPTRVHGYVRDTDGNPMTNVLIEATSTPPRLNFWMTPVITHHTRSGAEGHWKYTERKVGQLSIQAIPPVGYKQAYGPVPGLNSGGGIGCLANIGPFEEGDQPTNDFILILRRLPEPPVKGK
jgi:hypothetical protein